MSLLNLTALSHRPQNLPAWSPLKATLPDPAPQSPDPVSRSLSAAVPEDVSLRFEFNAITHAWMLAMTDAQSGEVVRQIKVFNAHANVGLPPTGQWVDKVV
jgi:hypothetical protein